jgi:hypothetical protein
MLNRLIRLPLRAIPKRTIIPIVNGPARGMRWVVGAADHANWLGRYEPATTRQFEHAMRPGAVVWDVGANAGYYTLMALALGARHVVAVEPDQRVLAFLRRHIALNGKTGRVTVLPIAAGDRDRNSLDGFLIPAPDVVKLDVEGAAGSVLAGMAGALRAKRPVLLIEMHSAAEDSAVRAVVCPLGYTITQPGPDGGDVVCLPH